MEDFVQRKGGERSGHHGHSGRPGSVGGSAPSGFNSPLVQYPASLENTELGLVELKTEQAVIFDSKSGKPLYHIQGSQSQTLEVTKEEWELAKGQIITHNHPEGHSPGPSPTDVLAAAQHGVQEIRVVQKDFDGNGWLFRMTANKGSEPWVKNPKTLRSLIDNAGMSLINRSVREIDAGKLTPKEADQRHWHMVWTQISEHYGWEYEKVNLGG